MSDEQERSPEDQSPAPAEEPRQEQVQPAIQRSVSQCVYAGCYYVSYGIVFPTVFVASFVPMDNPFGHGLIDGAAAARDSVNQIKERRVALKAARQETKHQVAEPREAAVASPEATPA
jgi:hypothetical protein